MQGIRVFAIAFALAVLAPAGGNAASVHRLNCGAPHVVAHPAMRHAVLRCAPVALRPLAPPASGRFAPAPWEPHLAGWVRRRPATRWFGPPIRDPWPRAWPPRASQVVATVPLPASGPLLLGAMGLSLVLGAAAFSNSER